jgi:hypothetical protein
MALNAHFKAGERVVFYHKGRIIEALVDGKGRIHRIIKSGQPKNGVCRQPRKARTASGQIGARKRKCRKA